MNWHDLSVVLAVARAGSFSGAGQVLKVAHTTISRRINDIEEKLGVKLFIRNRASCNPTDDCRDILKSIERMETEALAIGDFFHNYEQKPRGLVKLTTMPWIIREILVPALPTFPEKYSEIEIQFTADARERSIVTGDTDMLLRWDTNPRRTAATIDLGAFSYSLYAPRVSNPDQLKTVTYWEDYNFSYPDDWLGKMRGEATKVCFRANDAGFVLEAIRAGVGKGIVPDFLAAGQSNLMRLSGTEPEFVRTLKILYQPEMRNLTRIDAVVTWLQRVFKELPATLLSTKSS